MTGPTPELQSDELAESWRELRESGAEARDVAGDLTPEQLRWQPADAGWSVAECLEHLVLTGEVYLTALDEVIERGRAEGKRSGGAYRPTRIGRWVVRSLEPPPGLKLPAPGILRPELEPEEARGHGRGDPLTAFLDLREAFRERLGAADGLDLGAIRMSSPFLSLLRFDLGSAFRIVAAHERRHLWQARQVREAEGFPGADV